MGFKKVDPREEINKTIKDNHELETSFKRFDAQYELIEQLVEFRKASGITQKEVALKSGLTQQMVSRIEKIDYSPTLDNFLKYVLALGLRLKPVVSNASSKVTEKAVRDEDACALC